MAIPTPSPQDLIDDYCSALSGVPVAVLQNIIDNIAPAFYVECTGDAGFSLLATHIGLSFLAGCKAGGIGGAGGVASVAVGDVSVGFGPSATIRPGDSSFNLYMKGSPYGQSYLMMLQACSPQSFLPMVAKT